ncbi:MAG: major capsid protein [Microvirus sp.]|nr:MAG: major capsid protein [Microvirus sp.]
MTMQMHKNQSVSVHQFAMVPKSDIPRSTFVVQKTHKTTFDAGFLVPIYLEEVLPGDSFNLRMTAFARMATPLFPVMDNLILDSQFWFVPYRLLWTNWKKFMGEQDNPGDSISYVIPQIVSPVGGYAINTLEDYMGLPTVGQMGAAATYSGSCLPQRAYNKIWNAWYRDQNLQSSVTESTGDGPDALGSYTLLRRGKRPDYFTTALPSPQKGASVTLPLGTSAPVRGLGMIAGTANAASGTAAWDGPGHTIPSGTWGWNVTGTNNILVDTVQSSGTASTTHAPNIYADLSQATAATINQLRQSFQIQKLLEKDARGGTRYVEIIFQQFGVRSPDYRLQRPEYLGGGSSPINVTPIAQTSATGLTGGTTTLGNLSGMATTLANKHGYTASFTEHGIVMGLVSIRADLTYQQGVQKFWNRSTRYDFYTPVFQALGEQAVLNREIYVKGDANDALVFGYQERWAEYRYNPSMITGLFRSTAAGTIDGWHLAQNFGSLPTLNTTFIQDTPPLSRVLAVGASANGKQFIFDSFFENKMARPMPLYSVPGMIDHF